MAARKPAREITRWSPNRRAGHPTTTLIALHESVGMTNAWDLALYCERASVSYHDLVDLEQLVHTVPFTDTGWHLRNGNPRAIGLCLTTPVTGYTRDQWLGTQLAKVEYAAWWVARACTIFNLPIRHCNHEQIRSALRGNITDGGVITHNDYTLATGDGTHNDPRGFPVEECIAMARAAVNQDLVPEDDMATVSQAEWTELIQRVRTIEHQLTGPPPSGWPSRRYNVPPGTTNSFSLVDYARETDREINSWFDLANRPGGDRDRLAGHILSTHAYARRIDGALARAAEQWDRYIASRSKS